MNYVYRPASSATQEPCVDWGFVPYLKTTAVEQADTDCTHSACTTMGTIWETHYSYPTRIHANSTDPTLSAKFPTAFTMAYP